jgi:hypothetical protein
MYCMQVRYKFSGDEQCATKIYQLFKYNNSAVAVLSMDAAFRAIVLQF